MRISIPGFTIPNHTLDPEIFGLHFYNAITTGPIPALPPYSSCYFCTTATTTRATVTGPLYQMNAKEHGPAC